MDVPCSQTPVPWKWEGLKRDSALPSLVPIPLGVGLVVPSLLAACGTPDGRPDWADTVTVFSPRDPVVPSSVLVNTACRTILGAAVSIRSVTHSDYLVGAENFSERAAGVRRQKKRKV